MPKIAFWNVQRLGASTDPARGGVVRRLLTYWQADLYLFCELTTQCDIPEAQNMTYRAENAAQLCYGAMDVDLDTVELTAFTPSPTGGYRRAGYKGGNRFAQLADRALAHAGHHFGVEVYVIHAPASNNAVKVMSFAASSLDELHGTDPWLLIGDFNVEPDKLGEAPVGIDVSDLIRRPGQGVYTHYSPSGRGTVLDYALCNFSADVRAMRLTRWQDYSDHSPILVEF
jgi:hypothetical protein